MGIGIKKRQNDDKAIMMLAAQRQLYSAAKMLNIVVLILGVWIPLFLAIILLFFPESADLRNWIYVSSIISAAISFAVDEAVRKKANGSIYSANV